MRIIAGKYRSRLIDFPKTDKTRPLMDRMRETIFNVLGEMTQDAQVLDLFAGSGSFGIEALSRGAQFVCFVDLEEMAADVIKRNLESLKISQAETLIVRQNISKALQILESKRMKFNLIFIDPPYHKGFVKKILRQLERFDIVVPFGNLVVHRAQEEELPDDLKKIKLLQEKKLGQAYISFFQYHG